MRCKKNRTDRASCAGPGDRDWGRYRWTGGPVHRPQSSHERGSEADTAARTVTPDTPQSVPWSDAESESNSPTVLTLGLRSPEPRAAPRWGPTQCRELQFDDRDSIRCRAGPKYKICSSVASAVAHIRSTPVRRVPTRPRDILTHAERNDARSHLSALSFTCYLQYASFSTRH